MLDMDNPIARYWIAAARSGRVKEADWQSWADKLIATSDSPDSWLIEMSLAKNVDQLWRALEPRLRQEQPDEMNDDDAVLGHIWERHESGEISLAECLQKAAEEADSSSASLECETIYALLNELEASDDGESVGQKAAKVFADVQEAARAQWTALFADRGGSSADET